MSVSIQSQYSQIQTDPAAASSPQKSNQTAQNVTPQDTVTISDSARQAQSANNKSSSGSGDADHDGDSR